MLKRLQKMLYAVPGVQEVKPKVLGKRIRVSYQPAKLLVSNSKKRSAEQD
jgi:hypothetical protein